LQATILEQAHKLIAQGATAITTSCGFLSPLQDELQAALPVPVITSALWLLPRLRAQHGHDARSASSPSMPASCPPIIVPDDGPLTIEGLAPGCHLHRSSPMTCRSLTWHAG
jgi:hypothetical protein